MPTRAVPGYLNISKAMDQLAPSGSWFIGEIRSFGSKRLMFMMQAVMVTPDKKKRAALVFVSCS